MSEYIIRELNCETGEEIDRPATAKEIQQIEKDKAEFEAKVAKAAADAAKKAELLVKLGITEDEARLLLS